MSIALFFSKGGFFMSRIKATVLPPPGWPGLSGNAIKVIGIILMAVSHLYQMFILQGAPYWLNWFGRPVAAIFLFFCAEGFYYTRNKGRYMLQLLGGSLLMIALNMLLSRAMYIPDVNLMNNIFGTLFMATIYMWLIDLFRQSLREKKPGLALLAAGGMFLPFAIGIAIIMLIGQNLPLWVILLLLFIPNTIIVEGGFILVLLGALFYLLRDSRPAQIALLLAVSILAWSRTDSAQGLMALAAPLLLLYNNQRGRGGKYFFYIFYPAHLYLFYLIAWFLQPPVI
jgi:hypothetical protein